MNYRVSILGCGWLGFPLAVALVQSGCKVFGSTTTPSKISKLKQSGIVPFLIDLTEDSFCLDENFFNADVLFINMPFQRNFKDPNEYGRQLAIVLKYLKMAPIKSVLFGSSTSVYPAHLSDAREDIMFEPDNERSKALLKAEQLFQGQSTFDAVIVRLSGLCGYDRQIGRFLSGRTDLKNGNSPVNLIHRDDCVEIISRIISGNFKNEVFNFCCDGHPSKKELYIRASEKLGLKPPVFADDSVDSQKIVNNQKIKKVLNYSFKYPHPFDFIN